MRSVCKQNGIEYACGGLSLQQRGRSFSCLCRTFIPSMASSFFQLVWTTQSRYGLSQVIRKSDLMIPCV